MSESDEKTLVLQISSKSLSIFIDKHRFLLSNMVILRERRGWNRPTHRRITCRVGWRGREGRRGRTDRPTHQRINGLWVWRGRGGGGRLFGGLGEGRGGEGREWEEGGRITAASKLRVCKQPKLEGPTEKAPSSGQLPEA